MRGSIVRRPSKRGGHLYYVVLRNRWHALPPGTRQTKAAAEAYRVQLLAELARGDYAPPSQITVAEFADRWRAAILGELSPNTAAGMETFLRQYLLPALGRRKLVSLTREDVQAWKAGLLAHLSPSTVETALNRLKGLLRHAVDWRYLRTNPAAGVKRPARQRQEMRFLAPAQIRQLLDATPEPMWRAAVLVAITGGLRLGELCAATWANLDPDAGTYRVRESMVQAHGFKGFRPPKSERSASPVHLSPTCLEALRVHRAAQLEHRLATACYQDRDLIVCKADGRVWEPKELRKAWGRLLEHARLPAFRFHDLRHTCAALYIDQGENPKWIQEQMRHTSIRTTLDTYGHLFPLRGQEAAARLDRTLGLAG